MALLFLLLSIFGCYSLTIHFKEFGDRNVPQYQIELFETPTTHFVTIDTVRTQISQALGIDDDNQLLLYLHGEELTNTYSLTQYGIIDGSTLEYVYQHEVDNTRMNTQQNDDGNDNQWSLTLRFEWFGQNHVVECDFFSVFNTIQDVQNYFGTKYIIYFNNNELNAESLLNECNITNGSTLELVHADNVNIYLTQYLNKRTEEKENRKKTKEDKKYTQKLLKHGRSQEQIKNEYQEIVGCKYIDGGIETLFKRFNDLFFMSMLSCIDIKWYDGTDVVEADIGEHECSGFFKPEKKKRGIIYLSTSILGHRARTQNDILSTLLHEMIHAYIHVMEINDTDHGPVWGGIASRISTITGLNITVKHQFNDIVPDEQSQRTHSDETYGANADYNYYYMILVGLLETMNNNNANENQNDDENDDEVDSIYDSNDENQGDSSTDSSDDDEDDRSSNIGDDEDQDIDGKCHDIDNDNDNDKISKDIGNITDYYINDDVDSDDDENVDAQTHENYTNIKK